MNNARGATEWRDTFGGGFTPSGSRLIQAPLELLEPWSDAAGNTQPFRSYSAAELEDLADNIRQHGIITPLRLRPIGGRFQILSGHNRCKAAKLAGLRTVPAIVEDVDDDEAAQILVDSNLKQRQKLLPSEKAFAYKLRLEAMKRSAGRPRKVAAADTDAENCGQLGHNFSMAKSRDLLAESSDDSARQIQRSIRLTYLTPDFLNMVDSGKLKLISGVELSFLPLSIQDIVFRLIQEDGIRLSTSKAQLLHRAMPKTEEEVRTLLGEKKKEPSINLKFSQSDFLQSTGLSEEEFARLTVDAAFQAALLQAAAALAVNYIKRERSTENAE